MSTVTAAIPTVRPPLSQTGPRASILSPFATLSKRRFALSAHTPREIITPLLTPILFADVIAPALAKSMHSTGGISYLSFVAVGTIGLLVPLTCILGGIGMIVDRESGAQRDLLAAPVPRSAMVLGNLSVAIVLSASHRPDRRRGGTRRLLPPRGHWHRLGRGCHRSLGGRHA
jgi:hypothetical protein